MWIGRSPEEYGVPRSLPQNWSAPWHEWVRARLFGKRYESQDGPWHCIVYVWRGKLYWAEMKNIYAP